MSSSDGDFKTSRSARFVKLGALSGKVGGSYLGQAVKGAFVSAESRAQSLVQTNLRNALRVAEAFGELKGAVMKVGQMLSLQEDILPPEMREVLRGLQNRAPPVSLARLQPVLEAELGAERLGRLSGLSERAYASASIGQVHRARLDGEREVVVKIQYPGVDEMVDSDLKNLRLVARSLRSVTPLKADVRKFLREARARLVEELDYRVELANMLEFGRRLADDPRWIVPRPIESMSTQRVLTSEFQPGRSADELCAPAVPQCQRDAAGTALFELLYRQVYEFRTLHADPNFANFAFAADGRIVLYDFGCVKRFPEPFIENLRQVTLDALECRYERLPEGMARLGYVDLGQEPMPLEVYREFADAICDDVRGPGLYDFGAAELHLRMLKLRDRHWRRLLQFDAPSDALFLGRTFGGMLGNLRKLGARVPVHDIMRKYLA